MNRKQQKFMVCMDVQPTFMHPLHKFCFNLIPFDIHKTSSNDRIGTSSAQCVLNGQLTARIVLIKTAICRNSWLITSCFIWSALVRWNQCDTQCVVIKSCRRNMWTNCKCTVAACETMWQGATEKRLRANLNCADIQPLVCGYDLMRHKSVNGI